MGAILLGYLVLFCPDGHLPGRRWRWVAWVVFTAGTAMIASSLIATAPIELSPRLPSVVNPMAVSSLDGITNRSGPAYVWPLWVRLGHSPPRRRLDEHGRPDRRIGWQSACCIDARQWDDAPSHGASITSLPSGELSPSRTRLKEQIEIAPAATLPPSRRRFISPPPPRTDRLLIIDPTNAPGRPDGLRRGRKREDSRRIVDGDRAYLRVGQAGRVEIAVERRRAGVSHRHHARKSVTACRCRMR